jgi:transposase-like protein
MTREEAIAIVENEKMCVNRASKNDNCNRDCYNCELVKTDTEILEALDMAIKALKQDSILDNIKAEIENMSIVYDRSPNYEDDRTDEEKAVDWFNMDKLLFLQIIDKYKEGE